MSGSGHGSGSRGPVLDLERLIAMANQIGDFFAPYPEGQREEGVRNHLRNYWDPRMRDALLQHVDTAAGQGLHPHVVAGARLLREGARERKAYAGPPPAANGSGSATR